MDGRLVIGIKPLTIISMEKLDLEEFESIKKDFHKYRIKSMNARKMLINKEKIILLFIY